MAASTRHAGGRAAWFLVLAGGVLVGIEQLFVNTIARTLLYVLCTAICAAAIGVGVRRHRPLHPGPWYVLAVGTVLFSAANFIWGRYGLVVQTAPMLSRADLLHVAGTVPLIAGLVILVRDRRGLDVDAVIDGAIIGFALTSVLWLWVIEPQLTAATSPLADTLNSLYPVADLVMLSLVGRLWIDRTRTPAAATLLLGAGLAATFLGDVTNLLLMSGSGTDHARVSDATWLFGYVLIGAAALHPSMVSFTAPAPLEPAEHGSVLRHVDGAAGHGLLRVMTLGIALAIPAGIALVRGLIGLDSAVLVIGATEIVLVILVTARLARLVVVVRRQLADAHDLQATLMHQATHDVLTGLANRQLFEDVLRRALVRRTEETSGLAVVFLDLDHLEAINDALGYHGGDQVLRAVAARLSAAVRPTDTVARFGDAFVILLDGIASSAEAAGMARDLADAVRSPDEVRGEPVLTTATPGVAFTRDPTTTSESLLRDADAARLEGKERGCDAVVVFDAGMRGHLAGWLDTENELRAGLASGEMRLYYQPEVDFETGRLFGVEALIRWQHPHRGLVPPSDFLPVAETSGLIVPLGRWVVDEACRQARLWRAVMGEHAPRISINVSPTQLARENVARYVERQLHLHDLPANALRVEVTENALVSDHPAVTAQVQLLHDLGVELAVDDFGTGFFSLSHLKGLPIDIIKIDRSFVMGLGSNQIDDAIVQSVIDLSHRIGMRAVAEGVETREQANLLVAAGCDVGQGYLYARPMPAAELELLMSEDAPWGSAALNRSATTRDPEERADSSGADSRVSR